MQLVQFSSVVAGNVHNPSVLNPDFLSMQGIVPDAWQWKIKSTLTTPPIAIVEYTCGVTLMVEPNKLQVVCSAPSISLPSSTRVPEIVASYARTLLHVKYVAVGTNFLVSSAVAEPFVFLKSKFLKSGPWLSRPKKLKDCGVKFAFEIDDGTLNLHLGTGEVAAAVGGSKESEKIPERRKTILAEANFDRKATPQMSISKIEELMSNVDSDWRLLSQMLASLLKDKSA